MKLQIRGSLVLLFIIGCSGLGYAQGVISGVVLDKTELPVIGASVSLLRNDKSSGGTLSDIEGKYQLTDIKPGPVKLLVTAVGFKTFEANFDAGKDTTINIVLGDDALDLDAVVITGSSNPLRKLESSVAITTMSAKKIEQVAPVSTADLLKTVPGFVVETSGGEVGNNLFARGIPSAGAYEYVQMQEDGLPVFEDGALQFANADNWLRVDQTVNRMEAVRGGSGSIYASNAPGGIINFISKTGSDDFKGVAKLTTGTSSLYRADMDLSGALVQDKLFFNIGGFYRVDNGVRNPGYQGDRGGQLKLNLKYNLENGYVKFYYKKLDDRNQFLLPIPLTDKDHPKGIPNFDPNYGTFNSVNLSQLNVPQLGGGYFTRDLTNGVHPVVDAMGGEFKDDLGSGFSVTNNFRYTKIKLNYTAIFPGVEPQTAADFAEGQGISNPGYSFVNDGSVASPDLVAKLGYWAIDKNMSNLSNNLKFDYTNHKNLTIILRLYFKPDLLLLVVVFTLVPLGVTIIASLILFNSGKLKSIAPSFFFINLKYSGSLLQVGSSFFFIQMGTLILFQTDNIIITRILGPEYVTKFNIAYKLFAVASMSFVIIMTPYWSAFTDAYARQDYKWMAIKVHQLRKFWLLTAFVVIPLIYLASPYIYTLWLGNKVSIPTTLSLSMAAYAVTITCMSLNCYPLNGMGKLRTQLILYFVVCLINVPLCMVGGKYFGLNGVVLSNACTMALMCVILWIHTNKLISNTATGIWNK